MAIAAANPERSVAAISQFIVYFVQSVQEVLQTMANVTVTVGTPIRKRDPLATYDVSGIIGFSGEFVGSMVLSFPQATALSVVSSFAGAPLTPDSPDFADAVGELANMIAGSAKKSFGPGTSISVPNIIMGRGHSIARLHEVPCLVIPCRTDAGEFAVEVNIKSRSA